MSNSSTALQVYEMIKKHLSEHDFKFDTHDDDLVITLTVHGGGFAAAYDDPCG